jgi:hypothetical protein
MFGFFNVASAQVLAVLFLITDEFSSLCASRSVANVFFAKNNFCLDTFLADLAFADCNSFLLYSFAFNFCSVITFGAVFEETTSFLAV